MSLLAVEIASSILCAMIFMFRELRSLALGTIFTLLKENSPDLSKPSCIMILRIESFVHSKSVLSSSSIFAQILERYLFRESPSSNFMLPISCQLAICDI
ncbi:hypothetical protein CROQUDRAFT_709186 [Cronartium quercuum f. sp. fusiforme G11]|uniref:Uncharacterized protein n=1 Tax=Cronartium quercuum f. sp. fusiforme G11 TaxID=708437 RepID=A0A9P6NI47_9BASI|nr:hypothetical protein CROQUDRAFT_709186 [Cronartium quercuum f. sp. fusiforme G11]